MLLKKKKSGYDFYPDRRHLSEEFEKLWVVQRRILLTILTDELQDEIVTIIFHQRPLKEQEVGLCLFSGHHGIPQSEINEYQARIQKINGEFLLETVNNLRISARGEPARGLTREERDQIVHALDNKGHTKVIIGHVD